MADPFLGEIRIFGFNYAPENWAFCDGRLLPIKQNEALYSLIGTSFGGNGSTNFALPDLRGRIPVHTSSQYTRGDRFGVEAVALTVQQIPNHGHNLYAIDVEGSNSDPTGRSLGKPVHNSEPLSMYGTPFNDIRIHSSSITHTGGNKPHTNIQPSLILNFCIALSGIYPPRS